MLLTVLLWAAMIGMGLVGATCAIVVFLCLAALGLEALEALADEPGHVDIDGYDGLNDCDEWDCEEPGQRPSRSDMAWMRRSGVCW